MLCTLILVLIGVLSYRNTSFYTRSNSQDALKVYCSIFLSAFGKCIQMALPREIPSIIPSVEVNPRRVYLSTRVGLRKLNRGRNSHFCNIFVHNFFKVLMNFFSLAFSVSIVSLV